MLSKILTKSTLIHLQNKCSMRLKSTLLQLREIETCPHFFFFPLVKAEGKQLLMHTNRTPTVTKSTKPSNFHSCHLEISGHKSNCQETQATGLALVRRTKKHTQHITRTNKNLSQDYLRKSNQAKITPLLEKSRPTGASHLVSRP